MLIKKGSVYRNIDEKSFAEYKAKGYEKADDKAKKDTKKADDKAK